MAGNYVLVEDLEALVKAIVTKMIAEKFDLSLEPSRKKPVEVWKCTSEAWKELIDYGITSARELLAKRKGWFTEGVHYKSANNDPYANDSGVRYDWNIQKCKERLVERRAKFLKPKKPT